MSQDAFSPRLVRVYDILYAGKDYSDEAREVLTIARDLGLGGRPALLDTACGTGRHIGLLKHHFRCAGLDINRHFVAVARRRNAECAFFVADMASFELGGSFEIILNLFNSVNYMDSIDELDSFLACAHRHLKPGGALIIEAGPDPDIARDGHRSTRVGRSAGRELVRYAESRVHGDRIRYSFTYTLTSGGARRIFSEVHECRLFPPRLLKERLEAIGFRHSCNPRGWHIGVKQSR